MPSNDLDRAIRTRIDAFLADLTVLVKQSAVEAVADALGDGAPRRRGPGRPRGSGRRRGPGRPRKARAGRKARRRAGRPHKASARRIRRSPADLARVSAKVAAYVKAHPGQRLEEIGKGLKVDTAGLKQPIRSLVAAKKLRTQGQKRGTKYFSK